MSLRVLEVYGGGMGGGAARHLSELLPALAAQGLEVHLLSLGRDNLEPDGVTLHRGGGLRGTLRLLRSLRPDVVHTHGVRANLLGRTAAHLTSIPVVTTVHSFLGLDYRSPLRASVAVRLDDATLPWADRLIAISASLREDLIRRGARPEHVAVIPNGMPQPPPAAPEFLRGLAAGPILAIAARLHPAKGVDLAIRALVHLPDCTLAVLGEGPDLEPLSLLAAELGVFERVRFLGYRADMRAVIAGADVALVPSRAEGFGLAALEAMAQGVPVVAASVGGLPELVTKDTGVLVPPEEPQALAFGVRDVLSRRETLSAGARAQAGNYGLDATARRTAALLASLRRP